MAGGVAPGGAATRGTVAVRSGLFTEGPPPRLLASRCGACGRYQFPRHHGCPYCGAPHTEPVELAGEGRLWAWTAVTTAPPGYPGQIPYGFGVVELSEGVRVVTRLTEADPARLSAGTSMRLTVVPVHADAEGRLVVTYAFEPEAAA